MYDSIRIAPSILSADFMAMGEDIKMIERGGADFVHVDVMDGHFVPNLTLGVPFVKQAAKVASIPLDVHLMISNPLVQLPWFIEAGSDIITVHYEAFDSDEDVFTAIAMIKDAGIKACVSVKPDTPVEALFPFLPQLDMVLIMSVYPGFSGQSYIEGTEDRIAAVVAKGRELGCDFLVEVDGGISAKTVERVAAAGADTFVMGSACFGAADPAQDMADVRRLGTEAAAAHREA